MARRHVTHTQRRSAARIIASNPRLKKLAARSADVSLATIYRWVNEEDFSLLVADEVSKLRRAIAAEIPRDEVRRALGVAES